MGLFWKSKNEKLLEAARKGDVAGVRAALADGADLECRDSSVRGNPSLSLRAVGARPSEPRALHCLRRAAQRAALGAFACAKA